jgi:hypothetical protein
MPGGGPSRKKILSSDKVPKQLAHLASRLAAMRTGETIGLNELLLPLAALSESLVPAASGPFAIMHLPRLGFLPTL